MPTPLAPWAQAVESRSCRIESEPQEFTISEQCEAIRDADGPVPVEDEQNRQHYFLVDATTWNALQRQHDLDAIQEGLADASAGHVSLLTEAVARIRTNLNLPAAE